MAFSCDLFKGAKIRQLCVIQIKTDFQFVLYQQREIYIYIYIYIKKGINTTHKQKRALTDSSYSATVSSVASWENKFLNWKKFIQDCFKLHHSYKKESFQLKRKDFVSKLYRGSMNHKIAPNKQGKFVICSITPHLPSRND